MSHKYSVILCPLAADGGDVWKNPREVLETVAEAGYDGVDLDAEPDRIPEEKFNEVRDMATSLGLKIPFLVGAWGYWHAGEERNLASPDAPSALMQSLTRKSVSTWQLHSTNPRAMK